MTPAVFRKSVRAVLVLLCLAFGVHGHAVGSRSTGQRGGR